MQASQMSNWYQPIPVQAPLVQEFSGQPQSMLPSLQPHLPPQPQPQCGNFLLFQQMGPPVAGSMPPVSVAQAPSAMLTGGPPGVTQFSRFPVRVHQTYLNQMTQPINMYAQQPLLPIPVHVFQQQQGLSKNLIFPPLLFFLPLFFIYFQTRQERASRPRREKPRSRHRSLAQAGLQNTCSISALR